MGAERVVEALPSRDGPSPQPLSRGRERGSRRRGFDRERLPEALGYYTRELGALKGCGPWRQALCCFHEERTPSLSVNVESGHFRCFACDAKGDLLAFHMRRHGLDFKSACKALGAWR